MILSSNDSVYTLLVAAPLPCVCRASAVLIRPRSLSDVFAPIFFCPISHLPPHSAFVNLYKCKFYC